MDASDLCFAVWKSKSKMEFTNNKRVNEFVKPAHHKGWNTFQHFSPNVNIRQELPVVMLYNEFLR